MTAKPKRIGSREHRPTPPVAMLAAFSFPWPKWGLAIAAVAGGLFTALGWWLLRCRLVLPSSTSHLKVGRVWEYDMVVAGGVERTEVLESWPMPDGELAFRVEYRRAETTIDAVFTTDRNGHLIQLSQSGGLATFDPPLVVLGALRVGAHWSTRAAMVFPSKFRASSPTEVAGRVVGFETVTVPAGTFRAFRIEQVTNGRACTAWHAPGIGMLREVGYDEELVLQRIIEPT